MQSISTRHTFARKGDGRYKARLVARGFEQLQHLEPFAPCVGITTIKIVIAYATLKKSRIVIYDVTAAYLHSTLPYALHAHIPEGWCQDWQTLRNTHCVKIEKGLHGLKEAGMLWSKLLARTLTKVLNHRRSNVDPGLCHKHPNKIPAHNVFDLLKAGPRILMAVHVDDAICAVDDDPQNLQEMNKDMHYLQCKFGIKVTLQKNDKVKAATQKQPRPTPSLKRNKERIREPTACEFSLAKFSPNSQSQNQTKKELRAHSKNQSTYELRAHPKFQSKFELRAHPKIHSKNQSTQKLEISPDSKARNFAKLQSKNEKIREPKFCASQGFDTDRLLDAKTTPFIAPSNTQLAQELQRVHGKQAKLDGDILTVLNPKVPQTHFHAMFVGMEIMKDGQTTLLSQEKHADAFLQRYGLEKGTQVRKVHTPARYGMRIERYPDSPPLSAKDKQMHQSKIGSCNYLVHTRPDIAFTTGMLARFCSNPKKEHMAAADWLLRYIYTTKNQALTFSSTGMTKLVGYTDSDFAGDVDDRKSTTGHVWILGGAAISHKSCKQTKVADSTAVAELYAASKTLKEGMHIAQIFMELNMTEVVRPLTLYCDNMAAIKIASKRWSSSKSKHLDVAQFWMRQHVDDGTVKILHVGTHEQAADPMTKIVTRAVMDHHRQKWGLFEC